MSINSSGPSVPPRPIVPGLVQTLVSWECPKCNTDQANDLEDLDINEIECDRCSFEVQLDLHEG